MDILIIVVLILVGILLLLAELFLVPGVGIAGILAGGCLLFANYYAFANMGTLAGCVTLIVTIVACILSLVWFMRSKTLDKVALKKEIKGSVDRAQDNMLHIGDTGTTTTRLALIGYANVRGYIIEVRSDDGFIPEKTPIKVTRIADGGIYVKAINS